MPKMQFFDMLTNLNTLNGAILATTATMSGHVQIGESLTNANSLYLSEEHKIPP